MKRLHWLIIRSFLGPFFATFFIAMFFLVMQFLWKYVDDLMGKGLEMDVVLELLLYACADLIPMALPLAILLSSIMVMGKFGELSELTAMKSAGMSLFKIFTPLTVLVIFISIGSFFFSNYTWPRAHFKMRVLINDIQTQKSALLIKENEFYNDIENFSIRVKKKVDDSNFEDVFIADHNPEGNYLWREIYAERATMKQSNDGSALKVTLYDGFTDEEVRPNAMDIGPNPFQHTEFKKLDLILDMSDFKLQRSDQNAFRESVLFKSYAQLTEDKDSLVRAKQIHFQRAQITSRNKLHLYRDSLFEQHYERAKTRSFDISKLSSSEKKAVYSMASNTLRQTQIDLDSKLQTEIDITNEIIRYVDIARNRVFALSVAVLVLFFIGAPLGAIAKKGGLGYPVVIAVVLFIIYYMLSITGEKLAKQDSISPFLGMWLSSLILAPLALFLSYKANTDSVLFDADFYKKLLRFGRKK